MSTFTGKYGNTHITLYLKDMWTVLFSIIVIFQGQYIETILNK